MFEERMQIINDFFPECPQEKIKKTFENYNISIPDSFKFSNKINIVIGINGSGKTRVLKAVKDLYQQDSSIRVMYGYYPSIPDIHIVESKQDEELPEYSLADFLRNDNASFNDLLNFIAYYGPSFINDLISYRSKSEKAENSKILNEVSKDFLELTGKSLIGQNGKIYVEDKLGVRTIVEDALKLFSPGETMLLYMSIFLSLQKNNKCEKSVIILDEPESHLHPKVLLDFINMLQTNHKSETIWLATHSLFLIPQFKFENIVFVKDSTIEKRNSSIYHELKVGLLGNNAKNIETFFSSLYLWQYCEFIAECFTNPEVIDTVNPEDEQVQLFVEFLRKNKQNKDSISVLDFGGGSARLGLSLKLIDDKNSKIDYEIYDKKPTYTGEEFKCYSNYREINKKYDCIVLMNVLHEIEPDNWCEIFNKIAHLMKDDGYLLFVEVAALTNGEMPNDTGYLMLGREELPILFNRYSHVSEIKIKEKQKSVCFVIRKALVNSVTSKSINEAIMHLEKHSLAEIKLIRNRIHELGNNDKKDGIARTYAFWTQQYVNSKLYNEQIETQKRYEANKRISSEKATFRNLKKGSIQAVTNEINMLLNAEIVNNSRSLIVESIKNDLIAQSEKFEKFGFKFKANNEEYLEKIILLEKTTRNKHIIAIFLKVAALLGDKYCETKYFADNYYNYI